MNNPQNHYNNIGVPNTYYPTPQYDPAHMADLNYGYANPHTATPPVKSKKNSSSTMVIIFLVSIIFCISIFTLVLAASENSDFANKMDKIAPVLITGFFAVAGIILTIVAVIKKFGMKERCTQIVTATCVDIDSHINYDDDGPDTRVYCPIYEFYYNGQTHRVSNNVYSNFSIPQIGTNVQLFINPYEPEEFLEEKRGGAYSIIIFIGIVFMLVGILGTLIFSQAL
ncbi:MAG: DUF3592 domain-containing protein [Lachnospiraceae bacterium]|nr:DUF3592 domain-containing protein [Lachnospiraceae bacterium]